MRLNLPNQNMPQDAENAQFFYDAATMGTTHSAAYSTGSTAFAMPKFFDPARRGMMSNYGNVGGSMDIIKFDTDEGVRKNILLGCRNIMKTHPVAGACSNIYSRYPVQGIRLQHDDPEFERFYTELFLEDLDFQNYLIDVGKVYWTDGMAFAYGNWNDGLGVWSGEDLLDPINMVIERDDFTGEEFFSIAQNDKMKELVNKNDAMSARFKQQYPEIAKAINSGRDIPISTDRLTYLAEKNRRDDVYGTPTLLKAWNTLRLEDRMQSAMQAQADRMYAPLLMFNVGGTLPNGNSYIPSPAHLDAFRANLDAALSSDFRAIVTHSGVTATNVIDDKKMSVYKPDMEMYDKRIFMAYGLPEAIMNGNANTYASSALEFQLTAQILSTYQKKIITIYNRQAAMVAEAQGHYETVKKGDSLETVMEHREILNEETGEYEVKEVPKLSYPTLQFDTINFKDEQQERKFLMELKNSGIPIADDDISIGVDIDLAQSAEQEQKDTIKKKLDEARMHMSIYRAAMKEGLPVPPETTSYLNMTIKPLSIQHEFDELVPQDEGGNESLDRQVVDNLSGNGKADTGDIGNSTDVKQRPSESDEQRGGGA